MAAVGRLLTPPIPIKWTKLMPITVVSSTLTGSNLTWGDFTIVAPPLVDPADGHTIDAYTTFDYQLSNGTPAASGSNFVVPQPNTLTITPRASVTNTTAQTAGLLAHEAFHFDLGFCIGRVVAKKLEALSKPTAAAVTAEGLRLFQYHFRTRAGLIQARYDADTRHGTVSRYQTIWANRMATCKGDANATSIGGFLL